MLRHLVAVVVIAATVVVVPTAEAADPTAQAFVDTVALGSIAMAEQRPQVRKNLEALDLRRCMRALDVDDAPEHAFEPAFLVPLGAMLQATYEPLVPAMRAIVAAMDRIPTDDPALRSGRASWRVTVEGIASLKSFDQPCRRLEAWVRGGFQRSEVRRLYPPGFLATMERLDSPALERKLEAAARRLRRLGMTEAQVEMWTGDTAFKPIEDEMDAVFNLIMPDTTDGSFFEEPF